MYTGWGTHMHGGMYVGTTSDTWQCLHTSGLHQMLWTRYVTMLDPGAKKHLLVIS
jgi:hypothetical protein